MKTLIIITTLFLIILSIQESQGYNLNWKEYRINIPENIIELDYCYNSWRCEVEVKYIRLIKMNKILAKKWLKQLY